MNFWSTMVDIFGGFGGGFFIGFSIGGSVIYLIAIIKIKEFLDDE